MTENDRIIEAILEIELRMFLTVNPLQTSGCQEYPESFKLHRRAQFAPWSEESLGSYLDDLHEAQELGDNLMRRKYARMQGLLPPAESDSVIEEIVRLKMDWQRAMFRDYPAVMSGARPLTDENTQAQMTSFETYARGELETYSERTLRLLHRDLLAMQACGESLSEKVYDCLVRASGYASLEAAERKLKGRGGAQS
ncbi:MAG: DUF4125 family protein [Desulfobacteraceae bacterium]|nr:MAG: DUF4125 family protein [Desulfobacteraceae bacterium]